MELFFCSASLIYHSHVPKVDNYVGRTVNNYDSGVMGELTNEYQSPLLPSIPTSKAVSAKQ